MQAIRFLFASLLLVGTLVNVQLHVSAKDLNGPQPGLTNHVNTPAAVEDNLREEWQLDSRTGPSSVETATVVIRHPRIGIKQTHGRMQTHPNRQLVKCAGGNNQGQSASTHYSRLPPTGSQEIEGNQLDTSMLYPRDSRVLELLEHLVAYFDRLPSLNVRHLFYTSLQYDIYLLGLIRVEAKHVLQRQPSLSGEEWEEQVARADQIYTYLASRLRENPNDELHRQRTTFIADLDAAVTQLHSLNDNEQAEARALLGRADAEDGFIDFWVSELRKVGISTREPVVIHAFVPTSLTGPDRLAVDQIHRTAELSRELDAMVEEVDTNDVFNPRSLPPFQAAEQRARRLMDEIEDGAERLESIKDPAHFVGRSLVQSVKAFLNI